DLPPPAGEPVARPPPANSKPGQLGANPPTAPFDLADERDRRALEPEAVVLAHRLDAAAEVDPARAGRRVEQLRERRRERPPLVERTQQVLVRGRVQPPQQRQDLVA